MMRGWEREDDEKLLHLEKIMPQQWTIIAPTLGRISSQCIERYDKILDGEGWNEKMRNFFTLQKSCPQQWTIIASILGRTSSQCIERYDKLLDGENCDKLLPWEIESHPDQSKPAPPDPINMDDDEKKMLSHAPQIPDYELEAIEKIGAKN
ncbi:hypothetical protein P3S67_032633 [Capsicum chacoense]